jgi:hypothetical protein
MKKKTLYEKKYLLIAFVIFVFFFALKISVTSLAKNYVKNNFINEYILNKKYRKEIRYDQFYLLANSIEDFKTYLFCTSACLVMDPNKLTKNYKNNFNISLGAGQLDDFMIFFKWILKHKSTPEEIFIGLEFYSLSDYQFVKYTPHELGESNLIKLKNLILDTSFENFLFHKFVLKKNDVKIDTQKKKNLEFAKNGQRLFEDFFLRKSNKVLMNEHIIKLKNQPLEDFEDKIDNNQIKNLKEILLLAKKNDIKVTIFFVPIHEKYLKWNNGKIFFEEIDLIKKIFSDTDIKKIYYFNNFSQINKNFLFYEHDLTHINYDAAKLVEYDLRESFLKTGVIIEKKNLDFEINNLISIYEDNR